MGFLQDLGRSLRKIEKNISENIQETQRVNSLKRAILDRFEMNDLKGICRGYGIAEPEPFTIDQFTKKKSSRTVTREHYIERVFNDLKLDQIKSYCHKNRIMIDDLLPRDTGRDAHKTNHTKEGSSVSNTSRKESQEESEFDAILSSIKNDFEPEPVRDEKDFENQLIQFLKLRYPGRVQRQVETHEGKIDLVVDGKYALELKIAEVKSVLRDLVGQVHSYKKVYDDVGVVLLDVKTLHRPEIDNYIRDYEKFGVKTVLLTGVLRRKAQKTKQINIKI